MKKVYFAISYSNRKLFDTEVQSLVKLFHTKNLELFSFVDHYNFKADEEKIMMETAFQEIDESAFLVAELTTKSIGVGIEIGYANAKGKPIIYLRKKDAEYSTTAAGSSNYIIEYDNEKDLIEKMKLLLNQLLKL
ncbi:nucleoside 2-deoxyribosyltransferase [Aureivirga marina]|uniref:nucleoside 2-deoxyribosyltransferase n=1 Tax=Aureivirga marina TaxID=1182451 RepID=UPI0018C9EE6F|nr:nucleoside 2-deoxyribosyltransferase [Aureivirga marina]